MHKNVGPFIYQVKLLSLYIKYPFFFNKTTSFENEYLIKTLYFFGYQSDNIKRYNITKHMLFRLIIHIHIYLYCIIKELIFQFTRTCTIFNKYVLQTVIISIDYNLQFTLYDHSFTDDGSYANCPSTIFGNAQHGLE